MGKMSGRFMIDTARRATSARRRSAQHSLVSRIVMPVRISIVMGWTSHVRIEVGRGEVGGVWLTCDQLVAHVEHAGNLENDVLDQLDVERASRRASEDHFPVTDLDGRVMVVGDG